MFREMGIDIQTRRHGDPCSTRSQSQPSSSNDVPGVREMLLYEVLARSRMREAEEIASRQRLVRRLAAGRRWARLARYAAERAERTCPTA